jgi:hypothetical protein
VINPRVNLTALLLFVSALLLGCGNQMTLVCNGTDTLVREPGTAPTTKPRTFTLESETIEGKLIFTVDNIDFSSITKNRIVFSGIKKNAEFHLGRETGHLRLISIEESISFKGMRTFEGLCIKGERIN